VILITDGEDNAGRASLDDAVDAALEHDVTVFALNTNFTPQLTDAKLKMLAESTGGRVLRAYGEHEWKSAFRKVNQELRNQYLLAYKPPRWQASHSFHKIRIAARRAGLKIHCRKGYYESE
jgi:VWFA-related protein